MVFLFIELISDDMSLEDYNEKRNFTKTNEPEGCIKIGKNNIYVIQKHDASHLHYDLRLEMDGVLKSWAIPKEPPMQPNLKRLAIKTEDHPIEYAEFKGVIPEGAYGAGKVEIWDKGTFIPIELSSKNLIKPAPPKGIGALPLLLFFRLD